MRKYILLSLAALSALTFISCEERSPEEEDTGWKLPGYTLESINYQPVTMSICGIDLKVTLPEKPAEGVEFGVLLHDDPLFPHDKGLIVKTIDEVESSTCICFIFRDLLQRKYYYKGYYAQGDNIRYTETKSFFPGAVDLGLSVQWCCMNVGAEEKFEDSGNYYAWGEVETKETYTVDNYKYDKSLQALTPEMDVAATTLQGPWRMPTSKEFEELLSSDKVEVQWTTYGTANGLLVSNKQNPDIFIFFPAAGGAKEEGIKNVGEFGCYWASDKYQMDVGALYFSPEQTIVSNSTATIGRTVRAVCP